MATLVPKKSPIDISKRTAIGISLPFNGTPVFNQTFETREQIKANLINYLLTNKRERVFNPNFGADLRLLLFDIQDEVQIELRALLQDNIRSLFPTVQIVQFDIIRMEDVNSIRLNVVYQIQNFGVTDSISINLV